MSLGHLMGTAFLALLLVLGATAALYWLTLRYAAEVRLPVLQELVAAAQRAEAERERVFVQQNLNSMAMKLGEMQAQLTRLDALGERLSALAGIRPQEFRIGEAPGLGGAAPTQLPPQNLSLGEFSEKLLLLARQVESRNDMLGVLEAQLFEQAVKKKDDPDHDAGEGVRTTRRASASASIPSTASGRCTRASISSPTTARRSSRPRAAW